MPPPVLLVIALRAMPKLVVAPPRPSLLPDEGGGPPNPGGARPEHQGDEAEQAGPRHRLAGRLGRVPRLLLGPRRRLPVLLLPLVDPLARLLRADVRGLGQRVRRLPARRLRLGLVARQRGAKVGHGAVPERGR